MTATGKTRIFLLGVLVCIVIAGVIEVSMTPVSVFAEEEHSHGHGAEPYKDKFVSLKKKGPFKGYGRQASQFKSLCQAIKLDERLEYLVRSANEFSERDSNCEACRHFMQSFVTNCKNLLVVVPQKTPKVAHKEEHAEDEEASDEEAAPTPTPSPTPIVGQREPSAVVLDRAVRLFTAIADDEDLKEKTIQPLQKLKFVLLDKNRSTIAEREYFDILFTYIGAIFNSSKSHTAGNASTSAQQEEQTEEQKGEQLNSLFDEQ